MQFLALEVAGLAFGGGHQALQVHLLCLPVHSPLLGAVALLLLLLAAVAVLAQVYLLLRTLLQLDFVLLELLQAFLFAWVGLGVEDSVVGELIFYIALFLLLEVLLVAVREELFDVLLVESALREVHIVVCLHVAVVAVCVGPRGAVVEETFEGLLLLLAGLLFSGESHTLWLVFVGPVLFFDVAVIGLFELDGILLVEILLDSVG